jgi:hypothetical protein
MKELTPAKPSQLDPLAAALLEGLKPFACAKHIVLGGYFALKHYCDYRTTHDVDAWWAGEATSDDKDAVRAALREVLDGIGAREDLEWRRRHFGDTESWELIRGGAKVFTFQIAARTLQLEPYLSSPWPPLQIESLADNVGSKMNALVLRGAPRDYVDVRELSAAGLATPADCWAVWQRKNPDLKPDEARAEVARHLHELSLRRPLDDIVDAGERERARSTRAWFRDVFLKPRS